MNRLGFQARIVLISLAAGLPACAALLVLLWTGDHEPRVCATASRCWPWEPCRAA